MSLQIFYRIVKTSPPTPLDFASNRLKGLAPRGAEKQDARLWEGISMYAEKSQAEEPARRFPALGSYVAELQISEPSDIVAELTLRPGHYTVWGEPAALVRLVVLV